MEEQETRTSRVFLSLDLQSREPGIYQATAITAGHANGLYYPPQVLRESVPLWENTSVFVDHAGPADWGRPGGRSVRDLAGVFHNAAWSEEKQGITGQLRLLSRLGWLCEIIDECLALQAEGKPVPNLGLSADLEIERRGSNVTTIRKVYSLDIVMNPARGGNIEWREAAALGDPADGKKICTERILQMMNSSEPTISRAQLGEELEALRAEARNALIEARLAAAQLPAPLEQHVRHELASRPNLGAQEIKAAIEEAQALHARLSEPLAIRGLGHVSVGIGPEERIALAFERLLGLPIPEQHSSIPRLSGIRELYLLCTGDYELRGETDPQRAQLANLTTSTLTSIVKNALNKALLASFEMRPQWWKGVVWEEDFTSLNDVTWITTGGFDDLPTVAEGAAYTELANMADIEETTSFAKKGAYVGLTLEMIDRDDVAAVRAIPRKLGLAAARTLSSDIAALFTANSGVGPTLDQDSTALFHANHNNLGSSALSLTSWDATIVAMFNQTEVASGKKLGLHPAFLLVPIELEKTALEIIKSKELLGYGGGSSVLQGRSNVRAGSAAVVVVPEFTDTDDWAAVADPREAPGICVGYRYGRAPELFVAQDPLTGSMFTNDVMRIKVRFVYTVGVGEYRALYKHNVP